MDKKKLIIFALAVFISIGTVLAEEELSENCCESTMQKIENGAKQLGRTVKSGTKKAGKSIHDRAKKIEQKTRNGIEGFKEKRKTEKNL